MLPDTGARALRRIRPETTSIPRLPRTTTNQDSEAQVHWPRPCCAGRLFWSIKSQQPLLTGHGGADTLACYMAKTERSLILYADPNQEAAQAVRAGLERDAFELVHVRNGADALLALQKDAFDVVIAEFGLPGLPGLHLLTTVNERWPDVPVVLVSEEQGSRRAVEAVKAGAADFLSKPLETEELLFTVKRALAHAATLEAPPASVPAATRPEVIGTSPAIRSLLALTDRAAAAGAATVLIRGESGSGKELLARRVHEGSPRAAGPFVKVHCAALPEQLLESELFGYEKGAFTGAASRKPGRVELAQGGTLFLDEIGDISLATQVKLLRILQDREYERLGGTATLKADVRFVTATHRDLEQLVRDGNFREDLYYRLNVVQIVAPSLRERQEDIPALVESFCATSSVASGRGNVTIEPAGIELIAKFDWPGNVRQLQNFVERLVVLAESSVIEASVVRREINQINMARLRPPGSAPTTNVGDVGEISFGASVVGLEVAVRRAEKRALEKALLQSNGNRTVAARILGVSRRTLYNKLEEHGLTEPATSGSTKG